MKINILTQPLLSNYGGILQNYALQEILRRFGHEPLTLNKSKLPPSGRVVWKDIIHILLNYVSKIRGNYNLPFLSPYTMAVKDHELSFPQARFIKKYINKKDAKFPLDKSIISDYPAEAWIVGSDQVWRPWCSPEISNFFFDFTENFPVKRIAYAASFGTDQWEIDEKTTKEIKPLAKRFDYISVREASGVYLLKQYLDVESVHLLDPTLLLKADDYLNLCDKKDFPQAPYIAAYVLDLDVKKKKILKKESEAACLPVESIGEMRKEGYDSIERWLATFAGSEKVITDSFHGTVFSLIFRKPVKVITNDVRGNARLQSLIESIELKNDSEGYYTLDRNAEKLLNDLREKSLAFLKDALGK